MIYPGYYFDAPSSATPCAPCPDGCKKVKVSEKYFVHKSKTSESDIPVIVNVRKVNCPTKERIVLDCQLELEKLNKQYF